MSQKFPKVTAAETIKVIERVSCAMLNLALKNF